MAQTRKLALSVADEFVTYFTKNSWKFCFARGVKSGAQEYYLTAAAIDVAPHIELQWTETFSMATSSQVNQADRKAHFPILPSRRPPHAEPRLTPLHLVSTRVVSASLPILPGQAYTVPLPPAVPKVAASPYAPRDGFLYKTALRTQAILTQLIGGKEIAIFVTPEEDPLPENANEAMRLLPTIKIWFQQGAMVGDNTDLGSENVEPLVVDVSKMEGLQVGYDGDGKWSVSAGPALKGAEGPVKGAEGPAKAVEEPAKGAKGPVKTGTC
ncbi:hypothetical protein MMC30_002385 [Trapelia coarctata]|nr:hypothetical protein [Trapelia coarctata]